MPWKISVVVRDIKESSQLIGQAIGEFHREGGNQELLIDCFMKALLIKASEQIQRVSDNGRKHPLLEKLQEIRAMIYNEPQRDWKIEVMCREINVSMSYFQHSYKEIFGGSCVGDIVNARLELAKYYLMYTPMAIGHVAQICGYGNQIHFTRQFKLKIGLRPTEYRPLFEQE